MFSHFPTAHTFFRIHHGESTKQTCVWNGTYGTSTIRAQARAMYLIQVLHNFRSTHASECWYCYTHSMNLLHPNSYIKSTTTYSHYYNPLLLLHVFTQNKLGNYYIIIYNNRYNNENKNNIKLIEVCNVNWKWMIQIWGYETRTHFQ
jgi:hypothetical protein